jgi:hypothetical protein
MPALAIRPKPDKGRIGLLRIVVRGPARGGFVLAASTKPAGLASGSGDLQAGDRTTAAPGRPCSQTGAAVVA